MLEYHYDVRERCKTYQGPGCTLPGNADDSVCVVDNDSHPALEGVVINPRTLATELLQTDSQAELTGFNATNQFVSEAG